ncbi:MAG TPA: dienelactone hydrolase family protein [Dongiaceae bacterium]|nr:dienelactone hydrolase family protein [Dongiaceae bacterium]
MGQQIQLKASDGFSLAGYRADAAKESNGGKPKGGLVVIQEIFGVNHHIRNVCDRFAAQGYTSLAPAIFDRARRGVDIGYDKAAVDEGVKLRAAIKLEDTLKDVQAAIDALQPVGKVGIIGYCWGGSLAFLAAARLSGLACAVGYYGGMIAAHAGEKPRVPTILHFGEQDHGIPMADVEKVKAARPDVKVYTYAAGHGFSCDERGAFDQAAHEKALGVSLAFLKQNLEN